jgi:hypothetical protein
VTVCSEPTPIVAKATATWGWIERGARKDDKPSRNRRQQASRPHSTGTAVRPAKTSPGPWDAFADVDGFVDEVLAELTAKAKGGARPQRSGPKPPLAGVALRKTEMPIWCVGFCGRQWRAIGQLRDIPLNTLYGLSARWTRLGLWRRLLDRLRRTWRRA